MKLSLCERTWYVLEMAAIFFRGAAARGMAAAPAVARNSLRFITFLFLLAADDLHVRRQSEHIIRQILVDLHTVGENFEYLLAVALALDGERPHHAAADVAVLGVNRHLLIELFRLGVTALGDLAHRQLGGKLEVDRDH